MAAPPWRTGLRDSRAAARCFRRRRAASPAGARVVRVSIGKRAQQVQDVLRARGLDLTVIELPASTRTAAEAAAALGCDQAQIVKSLVFRNAETGDPVIVLASGANRVDERVLARLVGAQVAKADADYVKRVTGYAIGGVPPVGHRDGTALIVDEDLLKYDRTWAAAGTPHAVFEIPGPITGILPEHTVAAIS